MDELKSSYRKAVLLWTAMVGGIFIFLGLVHLIPSEVPFLKRDSSSPEVIPIKVFLLSFTVITLFLIAFVRSQALHGGAAKELQNAPFRLLFCSLATHLLCETVAVTGLTLSFLTGSPISFYPFMVLSLVLFAYFFPRFDQWEEYAKQVEVMGRPLVWLHPSLLKMSELHPGGAPAPGLFAGRTEGGHLRDAAQDGMYPSA